MQALQKKKKKCAIKLSVKEWTNYLGMEAFNAGDNIFERKSKRNIVNTFYSLSRAQSFLDDHYSFANF